MQVKTFKRVLPFLKPVETAVPKQLSFSGFFIAAALSFFPSYNDKSKNRRFLVRFLH